MFSPEQLATVVLAVLVLVMMCAVLYAARNRCECSSKFVVSKRIAGTGIDVFELAWEYEEYKLIEITEECGVCGKQTTRTEKELI